MEQSKIIDMLEMYHRGDGGPAVGVVSGRAGRRTTGRGRRGAAVWPVVAGGKGGGG